MLYHILSVVYRKLHNSEGQVAVSAVLADGMIGPALMARFFFDESGVLF